MRAMRLLDLSDRELLGVVHDLGDGAGGWAATEDIALTLRVAHDRPTLCVGVRLAYMAREHGTVERDPDHRRRWRLTDRGEAHLDGNLGARLENALTGLDDVRLVTAARVVAQRQRRASSRAGGKMARREWQRETIKR